MATENRGVMVYLPSELEAKIAEYCTEYNITRKDKQGNIVTSLGSGIVAYLKSQLLGDLPRALSNRPINGLTREEVLDLIAKSNTSSIPIDRAPDPSDAAVVHRLEMVEQKLSSSMGMERDEVEQLIQASEQKIMAAVRSMSIELRGELAEVKTIDERVNTSSIAISTTDQEKAIEDTVKSPDIDTIDSGSNKMLVGKELRIWVDLLEKDEKFREIIQIGVSKNSTNQTIVNRLFKAGYGKKKNTQPYPPSVANEIKIIWEWPLLKCNKENTAKSIDIDTIDSDKFISKDIKRWLKPLTDKPFRDIIQAGISDNWSNQEIVAKLFDAGYGKNGNIEPYTANLASAMKTAYRINDSDGNNS
ncbi:MAG: hypothetical protein LH613_17130 [Chamaesiphon sp.]|nr:hypothetical protein [Chamaesiphon sp.]